MADKGIGEERRMKVERRETDEGRREEIRMKREGRDTDVRRGLCWICSHAMFSLFLAVSARKIKC